MNGKIYSLLLLNYIEEFNGVLSELKMKTPLILKNIEKY